MPGLQPALVRAKYPTGETPQLIATFIKQFLDMRDDFPLEFHPIRWIHSTNKMLWGRMVGFALAEFEDFYCKQDYTGLLGLCSIVFCRATNTSTLSWSNTI